VSARAGNERCPFASLILSGDAKNSRDGYALGNSECPRIFLPRRKGVAIDDCRDAGIGIVDAGTGAAEEAVRKVVCPLFLSQCDKAPRSSSKRKRGARIR
jgi:hypothetical protein